MTASAIRSVPEAWLCGGENRPAAGGANGGADALVVGRDEDGRHAAHQGAAAPDTDHHRLPADVGERLGGQARRPDPGRDGDDDFHGDRLDRERGEQLVPGDRDRPELADDDSRGDVRQPRRLRQGRADGERQREHADHRVPGAGDVEDLAGNGRDVQRLAARAGRGSSRPRRG